jgi:two-component system, LytTR family, sensor kinase
VKSAGPSPGQPGPPRGLDLAGHPELARWGAHVLFWVGYFLLRTSAAASDGDKMAGYEHFPYMLNRTLVVTSYAAVTAALLLTVVLLGRRFSPSWRNAFLVLGALALCPVTQFLEEWWPNALMPGLPDAGPPARAWPFSVYIFQFGWVLPIWGLVQTLICYHFDTVAQARAVTRAQALAFNAQLRALHYQINPHFLFNTLNAISTLVLDKHNDLAERMLLRLSGFLRYSLDRNPSELARLCDELEAQRKYLEIEQTRFGDKLSVGFDIEPGLDNVSLPSLILQPILENAIKYAITPSPDGGRIDIAARREGDLLRICIDDNGPGLAANPAGRRRGVGLSNARERLVLIYGERAGLKAADRVPRGCRVEIWLPLEEEKLERAIAHPVG